MPAHPYRFVLTAAVTALAVVAPDTAVSAAAPAKRPVAARAARPATTEQAALAAAAASDERVEVLSLRSETTQVFAEPDGRLVAESAAVPQRVRRDNGTWEPVDLELEPASDGTVRPRASVADVRFSARDDRPLVTVVRGGKTFTLDWPTPLPEPSLEGDTARYPNVLTDVDLLVRATDTGFAHVLVVKTPAAAEKVRQVRFRLGGDATVTAHPAGGVQAVAGGTVLASAPPATMWDSARPAPTALRAAPADGPADGPAPEPSTPREPGSTANEAPVATTVVDDHLVLRPDPALLAAPAAAFPLFVDPNWAISRNKWAYATSNNATNGDTSRARVGKDPEGSRTYRSFFNFPTSFLVKKHVESAYVQMELDHSASCTETPTHMFHSGAIAATPRTKWSPSLTTWVAAALSRAPEGDGCDGKADTLVNFRNPKVTELLADGARRSRSNTTFGFCACNEKLEGESSTGRWKKFFPDKAKLIVEYATFPAAPNRLSLSGVACPASGTVSIGTPAPYFTATYEDGDEASNQTLTASYEFAEVLAGGGIVARTPPGSRSVPAGSATNTAALPGLLKNKRYRIRTRATDPAPYGITGPWSAWCNFTVDTDVPAPPTITVVTAPTLPGGLTRVTLTSNNKDVVSFSYGWDDLPLSKVTATGTTVKTATVTLTAPRYGGLKLYAYATDVTNNNGSNASRAFTVGRPTEAVARWRLESYPGADADAALLDGRPDVGGDTPLAWEPDASDTGWQPDARLLGGRTASFDRTRGGEGGAARATVPALDTSRSFSVAAWARTGDATTAQTVVSKEGSAVSVFALQYSLAQRSWCMSLRARDAVGAATYHACAPAASFAISRWTHLAGLYDDTESRVKLYVDGALLVNVVLPADFRTAWAGGWNAGGPVVVGRAVDGASTPRLVNGFRGEIADVQVFDRALVDADLVGQAADEEHSNGFDEPGMVAPVRVGRWDFNDALFCTGGDGCAARDVADWRRPLAYTPGVESGTGVDQLGLVLDETHFAPEGDPLHGTPTQEYGFTRPVDAPGDGVPVIRTDQAFTVAAWVRLDGTAEDQTVLSQDNPGPGFSGFDLIYRAADKVWVFSMRNGSAVAAVTQRSAVGNRADDPTDWHHLVAAYDPGRREFRLYVDGERVARGPANTALVPWHAPGPLVVGRADQPAGFTDWLEGSVDNVTAWQGVLTEASIRLLHRQESAAPASQSAAE